MAQYLLKVHLLKTADRWTDEGAEGKPRTVDAWNRSVTLDHMPAAENLDKMLQDYGLELKDFAQFDDIATDSPNERRFTMNRLEDDAGKADDQGGWLADYDIYVAIDELKSIPVPDFGLPEY